MSEYRLGQGFGDHGARQVDWHRKEGGIDSRLDLENISWEKLLVVVSTRSIM